jgi:hypothetical protein
MYSRNLWLRRVAAVLLTLAAVASALCAAAVVPYFLAAWSTSIPLLSATGVLAFALVTWGGSRLGARLWQAPKSSRFPAFLCGAMTLLFVIALYIEILRPSPIRFVTRTTLSNTQYWQLPTGSRAYSEYDPPTGVSVSPYPIVFLHGGPGMHSTAADADFYPLLAAYGFRVYLFDQAGGGLSDFLPVRDYKMARAVEDVEAIRQQIGSSKMILIG